MSVFQKMRGSLRHHQVCPAGTGRWHTLGTRLVAADRKHPKKKLKQWAAWKNKHTEQLFLEQHTRKRVICKKLKVKKAKAFDQRTFSRL